MGGDVRHNTDIAIHKLIEGVIIDGCPAGAAAVRSSLPETHFRRDLWRMLAA